MFEYKESVLATTHADAHGEKLSLELLEGCVSQFPDKIPMHQHHDLSKPTLGHIKNLRIIPHDGGFALVGDIYTESELDLNTFGGLSISATGLFYTPENYEVKFYIPYPYYNDSEFVEVLKKVPGIALGASLKKQLTSNEIGLIVAGLTFLLSPEWTTQYQENIRPQLVKALDFVRSQLWPKGICSDLVQKVTVNGREVSIYFIPDRAQKVLGYEIALIDAGLTKSLSHLLNSKKEIERITLVYYPAKYAYEITHIVYSDGSDLNIAP